MKKSLQLICLAFVGLIIGTGLKLMYVFPLDTQPFVEKKYAGWNGVLQAWICSEWKPGGSFIRWLNACATEFEKVHDGVYLEFTPVSREMLNALGDDSVHHPDLIFFSPGTLTNPNLLTVLEIPDTVRSDLQEYGKGYALPVAMGGYIWAYNIALCNTAPQYPDEITLLSLPADQLGYSAALLALLSNSPEGDAAHSVLPESGIDLGLPTSATKTSLYSENALDLFIIGELPCIPVNSNDLDRLSQLRDNGKGPDWKLYSSGSIACTDQLLLGSIPVQNSGSERAQLAQEFFQLLLSDQSQTRLSDIGAHGVTGTPIYPGFSVFRELDELINSRPLWLPSCFSEYSVENPEGIVRRFLNKDCSAKEALDMLGFEGM